MNEARPVRADDFRLRLFGEVPDKELLQEIIRSGKKPVGFNINELRKKLNYTEIRKLTQTALQSENMEAVLFLAKINSLAVANAISTANLEQLLTKDNRFSALVPKLYFQIRGALSPAKKKLFRRLVRTAVLKTSLKISGQGLRGSKIHLTPFNYQSFELDVEETLENIIGKDEITNEDIVTIVRERRKKNGVLILDTSGSMYGDKIINAALAAAVLAYHMKKDRYSVIAFNNVATILKHIDEKSDVLKMIDAILETEPSGYTNLSDALKKGLTELKKIKDSRKWAILITDGCYNKGENPVALASKYPKLHIIQIPSNQKWCSRVCRELATKGKGRIVSVKEYKEIPLALIKLLKGT